jgi:hypothetical protein
MIRYNLVCGSLRLIYREAVYEKCKLFQTRLYTCSKISNILYNLIFTTKLNDSSILITIISCDYLNLSLANEHVGAVTIPIQVIKYNQNFLQAGSPIRFQYSNQIKLFDIKRHVTSHWPIFSSIRASPLTLTISLSEIKRIKLNYW